MPALLSTLLVTALLLWAMVRFTPRWLPLDHPNARSLHSRPVPRAGGVALLLGWLAAAPWLPETLLLWPALLLGVVSLIDDYRGLPALLRLPLHLAAALAGLWLLGLRDPALLLALTLAVAWMTNLFNFMDGADGLAGGMAVSGFGSLAAAALLAGQPDQALLPACIAAASAAFLAFNFPPARLFMGDAGSIPLGLLAGLLGVAGWQRGLWPLALPLLLFSPFWVDATVTLFRRLRRGERLSQAHKGHYYQRLVRLGWTHRRLALHAWLLMTACAATGLTLLALRANAAAWWAAAAYWALLYAALLWRIDLEWCRRGVGDERA
jgi:UDP-N-acetylmuramyl pentapeptide phosphotransferase/UDP-N-acetylglucosamine-1-phosphate transferase